MAKHASGVPLHHIEDAIRRAVRSLGGSTVEVFLSDPSVTIDQRGFANDLPELIAGMPRTVQTKVYEALHTRGLLTAQSLLAGGC